MKKFRFLISLGLVGLLFQNCQTYYHSNQEFNAAFESGRFEEAEKWLLSHKPSRKSKNRFLYEVNLGTIRFLRNEIQPSNQSFEEAFLMVEDFQKKAGENVAAFLTNPKRITYQGERFEQLLIHYFKALNQLKANQHELALIETRRLVRKMNVLEDQGKKDKYNTDGFIFWMMGSFFEAAGEFNDAYIFYKKAHEAYQGNFGAVAKISEPTQLKYDLVRMAYKSGFDTEGQMFETKLGIRNKPQDPNQGSVLLLWHKGLGPIKSEDRVTFAVAKGVGGQFMFTNEEYGYSIPFFFTAGQPSGRLDDLKIITMALPKYVNRNTYYREMKASVGEKSYSFQSATQLNEIARADLKDRMGKELATAIGRVALKQAVQYAATKGAEAAVKDGKKDKKNEAAADLVGGLVNLGMTIANTATEVADTRNWQTLPEGIEVLRLFLPEGKQQITLEGRAKDGKTFTQNIEIEVKPGQTHFQTIYSF